MRPAVRPRITVTVLAGEPVGRVVLHDLNVAETLAVLHDHVEGLTLGIQDVRTDKLPLRLQCDTIGVPS